MDCGPPSNRADFAYIPHHLQGIQLIVRVQETQKARVRGNRALRGSRKDGGSGRAMIDGQDVLLLSIMKNEGPYVLEWVAHHLSVGFDRFMIFTNDCDDGTDLILDRLSRHIAMRHQPNPRSLFPDRGDWHIIASRYAQMFNDYKTAGWIYTADVDEFLQVAAGDGTLQGFRQAAGRFDVVSFTSVPFGSSGLIELADRPVMEQFTTTSSNLEAARAAGKAVPGAVKTLLRNAVRFQARRNHRPVRRDFSTTSLRWIDGSGQDMPPGFVDGKQKAVDATTTTRMAWFNHYAIRSAEAYLIKVERGDATGDEQRQKSKRYWQSYDAKGATDLRAATLRPSARAWLDRFMADPDLAELHRRAFAVHKEKAKRLRDSGAVPEFLHF